MNVLFVCNGNCSRSAMAEAYFAHLCQQNKLDDISTSSAGIAVKEEAVSPVEAKSLIAALGLSLEAHTPRQITSEIEAESDYIVCMEQTQFDYIKENFSSEDQDNKLHLLMDFSSGDDLDDPIEGEAETFEQCFLTMMPALAELADRFIRSVQ